MSRQGRDRVALHIAHAFSKRRSKILYAGTDGIWAGKLLQELDQLRASDAEGYLELVTAKLLNPYYERLETARERVTAEFRAQAEAAAPLVIRDRVIEEIQTKIDELEQTVVRNPYHQRMLATQYDYFQQQLEDDAFLDQAVTDRSAEVFELVEETLQSSQEKIDNATEAEVARVNHNLRQVKLTINRGLNAYNKEATEEDQFLARIVAYKYQPGEFVPIVKGDEEFIKKLGEFAGSAEQVSVAKIKDFLKKKHKAHYACFKHFQTSNRTTDKEWLLAVARLIKEPLVSGDSWYDKQVADYWYGKQLRESSLAYSKAYSGLESLDDRLLFFRKLAAVEKVENYEEHLNLFKSNVYGQAKQDERLTAALLQAEIDRVNASKRYADVDKEKLLQIFSDKKPGCDKTYQIELFTAEQLRREKNKTKKQTVNAIILPLTMVVGISEGFAAGDAINRALKKITSVAVASIGMGITATSGAIMNTVTSAAESRGPLLSILTLFENFWRWLTNLFRQEKIIKRSESDIKPKSGVVAKTVLFSGSAVAFSAGLALLAVSGLMSITPYLGVAIMVAAISFLLVFTLMQKAVSAGGAKLDIRKTLCNMFNFVAIWKECVRKFPKGALGDAFKRMGVVLGKIAIIALKFVGIVAAIASFMLSCSAFVASPKGPKTLGTIIGVVGSILALPTNALFVHLKLEAVKAFFKKTSLAIFGDKRTAPLGKKIKRLLLAVCLGFLKLAVTNVLFAATLLVGFFSLFWLGGARLGQALRHGSKNKDRLMNGSIRNHQVNAGFGEKLAKGLQSVATPALGTHALVNGAGQGTLYMLPMLQVFAGVPVIGWILGLAAMLVQGGCSFMLNMGGGSEATKVLGSGFKQKEQAKPAVVEKDAGAQWKEFSASTQKQFLTVFSVFAQHVFAAKKHDVPERRAGKPANLFTMTKEDMVEKHQKLDDWAAGQSQATAVVAV